MHPRDLMRDPFYAQLMFQIEKAICVFDRNCSSQGITLKDSQIQSALIKASAIAEGKTPKIEEKTPTDELLKTFIHEMASSYKILASRPESSAEAADEEPLDASDWIMTINGLIHSIKTRRSSAPGTRDYLDFVHGFVAKARK